MCNVDPTALTLGRHCANVIQMFLYLRGVHLSVKLIVHQITADWEEYIYFKQANYIVSLLHTIDWAIDIILYIIALGMVI